MSNRSSAWIAETGRTLWSYRYGWPYDGGGLYPGPRSTPTVHGGKVYFAAPNGLVGCLTAERGTLVWSVNVNEKFQRPRHRLRLFRLAAGD